MYSDNLKKIGCLHLYLDVSEERPILSPDQGRSSGDEAVPDGSDPNSRPAPILLPRRYRGC